MRVRKKPVETEAIQWTFTNFKEIYEFLRQKDDLTFTFHFPSYDLTLQTNEGRRVVGLNDWIVKGTHGCIYPVKKEVFDTTYEEIK